MMIAALVASQPADCCTTAIFSGKVTEDGRPIIWKNRDGSFLQNRVEYVAAGDSIEIQLIAAKDSTVKLTAVSYKVTDSGKTYSYKVDNKITSIGSW